MPIKTTNAESQGLTPSALLSLFTMDLTPIGNQSVFYFCDSTSSSYQNIVFGGITYVAFPVQMKDFGYDGQGGIVRPKLTVSNIGGFVSSLLLQNQDLVGASVTLTRVFARFIDAANWPGGVSPFTPDPTAAYAPEIFYVNRKTQENQSFVEWELSTAFELDSRRLPSRTCLANFCPFRYRDPTTCGYSGPPVADSSNRLFTGAPYNLVTLTNRGIWSSVTNYSPGDYVTIYSTTQALLNIPQVYVCTTANTNSSPLVAGNTSWVQDGCSKTLAGCRARFPFPAVLPFGGYPGISTSDYVAGYNTQNS